MSQWEEVNSEAQPDLHQPGGNDLSPVWDASDEEPTPFGGVERPDGLVYSGEAVSPELQWSNQPIDVPLPPVRPRPQPQAPRFTEPWKPGPDPVPSTPRQTSNAARLLMVTLIPLAVLASLAMLVMLVMNAYGF